MLSRGAFGVPGVTVLLALASAPAAALDIMPYAEVRAGQRCQGQTVLAGESLTSFTCEVLGVLPDFVGPHQHLVLVRLQGEAIEYTGVVSGMSGSPVYVEGRLLGAVSYRFGAFSKEPIAGVTPVESMRAIAVSGTVATAQRARSPSIQGRLTAPFAEGLGEAVPIETPLVLAGAPAGLLAHFGDALRQQGLAPVRGGAGAASPAPSSDRFFAGGPMAGVLVAGDLSVAALGTVTWVEGDKVYGFGHPFLGRGQSRIPLAYARVVATLPSLLGSSKLGYATRVAGTLVEDRSAGVLGQVGVQAPTIPITVSLRHGRGDPAGEGARRYRFQIAQDPVLTPLLAQLVVAAAVGDRIGFDTGGSAMLRAEIPLAKRAPLLLHERVSVEDGGSVAVATAIFLAAPLLELWRNPFEPIEDMEVRLEVELDSTPHRLKILSARLESPSARPGQSIALALELEDYRRQLRHERRLVRLPPSLPPGTYNLHLSGHKGLASVDQQSGRLPTPRDLDGLLERLRQRRRGDRLYTVLERAAAGMRVAGLGLPNVPPSLRALLGRGSTGAHAAALTRSRIVDEADDLGAAIEGHVVLNLEVLDREARE